MHTRVILKVESHTLVGSINTFIIVNLLINGIPTIINSFYFNKVIRFIPIQKRVKIDIFPI